MAQTGYTPILIYSSSTGGNAPAAGNLTNSTLGSELAINITDGKLFYKDNANAIQVIGWKVTPTTAGGTGLTAYTAGDMLYYASGTTLSKLAIGGSGYYMSSSGTAPQWNAPAALTKTDDTNVTLTLGGSASTALLNAASLTLGWTGQLAVTRGGTGLSSVAQGDILYGSAANTLSALTKNTTATRYLSNTGTSNNPAWAQVDLTNGVTGTLPAGNGGTGITSLGAGVATWLGTPSSANLAAAVTDETGSGALVFATSPTLITPVAQQSGSSVQLKLERTGGSAGSAWIGADNTDFVLYNAGPTSKMFGVNLTSGAVKTVSTISVGNVTPATTGAGITFPAAQSDSSDANTLDDYEEGTWTPSISFGGATTGQSYSMQRGYYTKVGNKVIAQGQIIFTNKGSATGTATINLPFTASASVGGAATIYLVSVSHGGFCEAFFDSSGTVFTLQYNSDAGGTSNIDNTNFVNTSRVYFEVSYQA